MPSSAPSTAATVAVIDDPVQVWTNFYSFVLRKKTLIITHGEIAKMAAVSKKLHGQKLPADLLTLDTGWPVWFFFRDRNLKILGFFYNHNGFGLVSGFL